MRDPRDQLIQFIVDQEPNCLITLGAGLGCSPLVFERNARHFFNLVQREGLGRNWYSYPAETRLAAIGVLEKVDTNMHMHLAVRATRSLQDVLKRSNGRWKRVRKAGHYFFDGHLDSPELFARYMTKEFWRGALQENLFIYAPSPS